MPSDTSHCQTCEQACDVILTINKHDNAQVGCPHCQGNAVQQMVTAFTAVTSRKS